MSGNLGDCVKHASSHTSEALIWGQPRSSAAERECIADLAAYAAHEPALLSPAPLAQGPIEALGAHLANPWGVNFGARLCSTAM